MNMSEVDREQLAADNMKLVYFVLKKYYPTFAGNEEIIGCGMYGLARACKYYNPDDITNIKLIQEDVCVQKYMY